MKYPGPMERHGGRTAIGMTKLLVRASLSAFFESEPLQTSNNLRGLQNRESTMRYATATSCVPTNSASNAGSPSSNNNLRTS